MVGQAKSQSRSLGMGDDVFFNIANTVLLSAVLLLILFPLWFIVVASISDPNAVFRGEVFLYPKGFTLMGYDRIVKDSTIWTGYLNSLLYAVGGAGFSLALILPFAYAISRKAFVLRKTLITYLLITMYFHGGLIPTFLLVRSLGLYNTRLVIIVLGSVGVWNVLIARTFFSNSIPDDMWEAALIDGCSHYRYFFTVVLPLSKAIVAVLALYVVVAQWNDFFRSLIYLKDPAKYSLQLILRNILIQSTAQAAMMDDLDSVVEKEKIAALVKYGVIIVASIPLLVLYPFVQKYFTQGIMIGAVKG
jgi:putative aldouronate transport system permease protein